MTKKLYSLEVNGEQAVSVEMELPDFMTKTPTLNRQWLRGIITEQIEQRVQRQPRRTPRAHTRRPAKAAKAVA